MKVRIFQETYNQVFVKTASFDELRINLLRPIVTQESE